MNGLSPTANEKWIGGLNILSLTALFFVMTQSLGGGGVEWNPARLMKFCINDVQSGWNQV